MLCGLIRILSRIEWWLGQRKREEFMCRSFCLICKYYDICRADWEMFGK